MNQPLMDRRDYGTTEEVGKKKNFFSSQIIDSLNRIARGGAPSDIDKTYSEKNKTKHSMAFSKAKTYMMKHDTHYNLSDLVKRDPKERAKLKDFLGKKDEYNQFMDAVKNGELMRHHRRMGIKGVQSHEFGSDNAHGHTENKNHSLAAQYHRERYLQHRKKFLEDVNKDKDISGVENPNGEKEGGDEEGLKHLKQIDRNDNLTYTDTHEKGIREKVKPAFDFHTDYEQNPKNPYQPEESPEEEIARHKNKLKKLVDVKPSNKKPKPLPKDETLRDYSYDIRQPSNKLRNPFQSQAQEKRFTRRPGMLMRKKTKITVYPNKKKEYKVGWGYSEDNLSKPKQAIHDMYMQKGGYGGKDRTRSGKQAYLYAWNNIFDDKGIPSENRTDLTWGKHNYHWITTDDIGSRRLHPDSHRIVNNLHLVKDVLMKYGLDEESHKDALMEIAGFKTSLGRPGRGRTPAQLQRDFLNHMNAANYKDFDAFQDAKKRIQKMSPADFAIVMAAIMSDEEDEALDISVASHMQDYMTKQDYISRRPQAIL